MNRTDDHPLTLRDGHAHAWSAKTARARFREGLTGPTAVQSHGPAPTRDGWPHESQVDYWFPANELTAANGVHITWYDGVNALSKFEKPEGLPNLPGQGSIFIGDKGSMVLPHWGAPRMYPAEKYQGYKYPKLEPTDHYHQFVDAVRGEGKTLAPYDYSGPLTESVLLGGIAVRFPKQKLEWDAKNIKVTNVAEANNFVQREYRKGWEFDRLLA